MTQHSFTELCYENGCPEHQPPKWLKKAISQSAHFDGLNTQINMLMHSMKFIEEFCDSIIDAETPNLIRIGASLERISRIANNSHNDAADYLKVVEKNS